MMLVVHVGVFVVVDVVALMMHSVRTTSIVVGSVHGDVRCYDGCCSVAGDDDDGDCYDDYCSPTPSLLLLLYCLKQWLHTRLSWPASHSTSS